MPWWKHKAHTNISMAWSSESLAQEHAEIMFKPAGSAGMNTGVLISNRIYNLGTTELRDGKIAKKYSTVLMALNMKSL